MATKKVSDPYLPEVEEYAHQCGDKSTPKYMFSYKGARYYVTGDPPRGKVGLPIVYIKDEKGVHFMTRRDFTACPCFKMENWGLPEK